MPRYAAPNHKDCWIDCPAGGYAIFVPPHGPCEKGCDEPGEVLAGLLDSNIDIRFSYQIRIEGRDRFYKLCLRLSECNLSYDDRTILGKVIELIPSARPKSFDHFTSKHDDVTISRLIADLSSALPGGRGGGNDNSPSGSRPSGSVQRGSEFRLDPDGGHGAVF